MRRAKLLLCLVLLLAGRVEAEDPATPKAPLEPAPEPASTPIFDPTPKTAPPPALAPASAPKGADSLRRFFTQVHSYTAAFSQVLLDDAGAAVQESSGTVWIARPNQFRWDYDKPFKQQIVGDGERIWMHDEELRQVTVRDMRGGLADAPALILAGKGKLEDQFTVQPAPASRELEWVRLVPKRKDTGIENLRIGFDKGKINVIEIVDGFGQRTRYTLRNGKENVKIDAARFAFTPPPGVDVVGE